MRTLRDEFAMAALTGILANDGNRTSDHFADHVADAYMHADAMLKARGTDATGDEPAAPYWARIAFFGHAEYCGLVSEVEVHGQRILHVEERCPQGHLLRAHDRAPSSLFDREIVDEAACNTKMIHRVCSHPEHVVRCARCGKTWPQVEAKSCPGCGHAERAVVEKQSPDLCDGGEQHWRDCTNHHRADLCHWPKCDFHPQRGRQS